MGRKSGRGKEKKMKKKEEESKLAAMWAIIEAANSMEDPMSHLQAFKSYHRHGLNLSISCQRVAQLDEATVEWAINLTKENMQALYEKSEWGWDDEQKRKEMTDKKAWYLIVRDESITNRSEEPVPVDVDLSKPVSVDDDRAKPLPVDDNQSNLVPLDDDSKPASVDDDDSKPVPVNNSATEVAAVEKRSPPVAVVHFRFDMEDEQQVLYCYEKAERRNKIYEIQLCTEVRRKGLGKFLMQILQLIAFKTGMLKVMVTVFRHNTDAREFFIDKLKFVEDETSPVLSVEDAVYEDWEGLTYQILSKPILYKQHQQPCTTVNQQASHHHCLHC